MSKRLRHLVLLVAVFQTLSMGQSMEKRTNAFQPLSYAEADKKAGEVLEKMTLEEKIAYVGGDKNFFIRAIPRLKLSEVYMSDATQGVHLRKDFHNVDISKYQLEKSTAFPCPIELAATWNPDLAYRYAEAVGEECRAGGIGFLLGPGMNNYRISQCGRNFEYFGEDPFLRAQMISEYVKGVQSTGTVATLKHFVANNTDWFRRKSNSIVDERTLNEIYLPPFKAGIDAGAKAIMTSYNLLNGEWCSQSSTVINTILRKQLGFQWLVMTDWWAVDNGELLAKSGQDLEMPYAVALKDAPELIKKGTVSVSDIDRMARSILRTYFAMRLGERKKDDSYLRTFENHERVALQTAREGIVLLKNADNILPIGENDRSILSTGTYVDSLAMGGGSATVEGYNNRLMVDELMRIFGERIHFVKEPTIEQIRSADVVLCNVGTSDSEGWDRPYALPPDQEKRAKECVNNNPRTIVIVTSGSGVRMTDWSQKAAAILYAWYGGQTGNTALAEIIAGMTNPSGKLPMTIEREFTEAPGHDYIPAGEGFYVGWNGEGEKAHKVYDVRYDEGVFVGYRWYETNNIPPLYAFGHGLSYTAFEYSDLTVSKEKFRDSDELTVQFSLKNTGQCAGLEAAQLYIQDVESSIPRPIKELKGFKKVELKPGEGKTVTITLHKDAFSFWNPATKGWYAEKGKFVIHVGSSSTDIRLRKNIELY